jgi:hypothetical protein
MKMMTDHLVKTPRLRLVQSQTSGRLFAQKVVSSRVHPCSRRTKEMILDISVSTVDMIQDPRRLTQRIGISCSMSILSRTGIEWIKSKTGDVSFLRIISPESIHENPWNQWRPDVFHDLFASKVFKPLPSRSEVFSLMKDFFRTANRLFPIYLESSFMKMVEWQYTQQTCDDAARWANINMVICLAYDIDPRIAPSQKKTRKNPSYTSKTPCRSSRN